MAGPTPGYPGTEYVEGVARRLEQWLAREAEIYSAQHHIGEPLLDEATGYAMIQLVLFRVLGARVAETAHTNPQVLEDSLALASRSLRHYAKQRFESR